MRKLILILFLPLGTLAAENPLDCMTNAPASASQCKPGETPRGSVRIEVKHTTVRCTAVTRQNIAKYNTPGLSAVCVITAGCKTRNAGRRENNAITS